MRVLLDTHAVIWFYDGSPQLSIAARDALLAADQLFVSVASAWEYELKRKKRPLQYPASFLEMCEPLPAEGLGLEYELHIYAQSLPPIHSDPFDRMLVAQAIHHDLTLMTKDTEICKYPVRTLW